MTHHSHLGTGRGPFLPAGSPVARAVAAGVTAAALWFGSAAAAPRHAPEAEVRNDMTCLALSIYHEARNQPFEGQLAIAHVILNRRDAARQPTTICEVVFKGREFSWTLLDRDRRIPTDQAAWVRARWIAIAAVADRDDDPVAGSTYFHSVAVRPAWAPAMIRVARIGDHVFYADPRDRSRLVHMID
jgi:spore germination cell wall hydrolase CwlJ-like protein